MVAVPHCVDRHFIGLARISRAVRGCCVLVGALTLASFSLANVVPPPNPHTSCASAEYDLQKAQQGGTVSGQSQNEPTNLMVVAGSSPLNTTRQIKMGQQVTVCVMGLYNWIYVQKKNPATLRLFIGGNMLEAHSSGRSIATCQCRSLTLLSSH